MAYIARQDEDSIAHEIFGPAAGLLSAGSFNASFDEFNKSVDRYHNHSLGPHVHIGSSPVMSPRYLTYVIKILKSQNNITLQQLITEIESQIDDQRFPTKHFVYGDVINSLIGASVHSFLMIKCFPQGTLGAISSSRHWTNDEQFNVYLNRTIPRKAISLHSVDFNAIKAWKLQKRGNIRFLPTNDLSEHLLYDRKRNIVFLFHKTEFLKAQLQLSRSADPDASFIDTIQRGHLPPRLVAETLFSWYYILFRPGDVKSDRLLNRLIQSEAYNLDKECENRRGLVVAPPEHGEYHYWGTRILELQRLAHSPKPNSSFFRWLDRNTTDRNALYVAILGLFLGALFGLLGFIVGIFQTVLAYKALQR